MIDSIKQKLEKLNPIEPTSLKKAGVFIGILYHDEFIENPDKKENYVIKYDLSKK